MYVDLCDVSVHFIHINKFAELSVEVIIPRTSASNFYSNWEQIDEHWGRFISILNTSFKIPLDCVLIVRRFTHGTVHPYCCIVPTQRCDREWTHKHKHNLPTKLFVVILLFAFIYIFAIICFNGYHISCLFIFLFNSFLFSICLFLFSIYYYSNGLHQYISFIFNQNSIYFYDILGKNEFLIEFLRCKSSI